MDRERTLSLITDKPEKVWDVVIIGGGATGLGTAVDCAQRNLETLLLEKDDFTKGTSSRSTKLVHGGVRYLAQGDLRLVMEALKERGILLRNAPHVTFNQSFIVPAYSLWKTLLYITGLKIYDLLSGRLTLGRSVILSRKEVLTALPGIESMGLKAGIEYHDGQFDDARLGINLAQTAAEKGAFMANYVSVTGLRKSSEKLWVVSAQDRETGQHLGIRAKVVVNCTGVFAEEILCMESGKKENLIKISQGTHIVLEGSFLPGEKALMIPETSDGRVLFVIPWHGKLIVGTTDTPVENSDPEPGAFPGEIDFILENVNRYLVKKAEKKDILSVFTGLRPLVKPEKGNRSSKDISRSHRISVSEGGLITVTGGKWTTYRKMGEETADVVLKTGGFPFFKGKTADLRIHGYSDEPLPDDHLKVYGSDNKAIRQIMEEEPGLSEKLHPDYPYTKAEVVWAVRKEMARTIEDVLARRIRILLLDARAAMQMAPVTAQLMAKERNKDQLWIRNQVESFEKLVEKYIRS